MSNVQGAGAAQAKTGENADVLDRARGMSATMGAVQNKTKTQYPASSMANHWTGVSGYGDNENICGYSDSKPPVGQYPG